MPDNTRATQGDDLSVIMKKQLFFCRLTAIFVGLMLVAVVVSLSILVPNINNATSQITESLDGMKSTMENLDGMTQSFTEISDSLGTLVGDNSKALTESIQKLSEVDVDSLNAAVGELKDTMNTLSDAMKRLSSFSLFR